MATTETPITNLNLNDAVTQAFEKESQPTTETEVAAPVVETKKEEKAPEAAVAETPTVEVEASPEEVRNALNLLRQLNDPAQAEATFEYLAKQGGYDLTKKTEVKALARDSKAILKEKLGDHYDILNGEKIAEALDEIVQERLKTATKPLEENQRLAAQAENERQADAAMQSFFKRAGIDEKMEVREELAGKMMKKMEKLPPARGTNVDEYLDDIYKLVAPPAEPKKVEREVTKKVVDRINKNAKEAKASGEGSGIDESRIKVGSKNPSLDEAVRAGFEGKRFDFD
jgi:hypothetical protein